MQFDLEKGKQILKERLGKLYIRARIVLCNYERKLSFDVINVLIHASDQGEEKIKEVLGLLEEHFEKHLTYQHPKIRGVVYNSVGINETQAMFLNICKDVLGLKQN